MRSCKTFIGVLSLLLLASCQSSTNISTSNDGTTQNHASSSLVESTSSSVSPMMRTIYTIPEIEMSFTYASDKFQEPWSGGGPLVILYEHGQPVAGAGAIRFSFFPKGEIPEYGTWHSDFIGDIVTESTLQTICKNPRWPKDMFVDCKIVQGPVPHAEFYIGDDFYYIHSPHKAAIFFTHNPSYPGLFVDVNIWDVPDDIRWSEDPAVIRRNLQSIALGKIPSELVQEFDRIIASIQFQ